MKHKSVAISGGDLYARIFGATDEWPLDVGGFGEPEALAGTWWRVSWPEHVSSPRFNGDANYRACKSEQEARESADCVYGERF